GSTVAERLIERRVKRKQRDTYFDLLSCASGARVRVGCSMIRTSLSLKIVSTMRLANSAGARLEWPPVDEEAALLVVAHVYRGQNEEEIIRILSAREASKRERRLYIQ